MINIQICQITITKCYIVLVLDECTSNPCVNGVCRDTDNDFICQCESGYTDKKCDIGKSPSIWSNGVFDINRLL